MCSRDPNRTRPRRNEEKTHAKTQRRKGSDEERGGVWTYADFAGQGLRLIIEVVHDLGNEDRNSRAKAQKAQKGNSRKRTHGTLRRRDLSDVAKAGEGA